MWQVTSSMRLPVPMRAAATRAASTHRGHPSIEELVAEQGTRFCPNAADLLGDFSPEEESIEDLLKALHEGRGHDRHDRAA
jgi:hypothetical protein